VSNVPAAMLCICIGQMCSENKVSYTNIYIFVICTVLLLSGVLFEQSISFNSNKFENPMYFVGSVLCGMYFVFYISKKIAEIKVLSLLSKVLIALGQSSLYIMALHLSCFKIVDYIIDIDSLAQLTPMADNLIEVIVFALFGLGVPYVVWKMRNVIWSRLKKQ
jgi:fucose 4-O-acetylase-like acetyltransferase